MIHGMIPLFQPNITESDTAAVAACLASGRIGPGPCVTEFEAMLCEATGKKHAVCCNSGTTALMLSIMAISDEVSVVSGPEPEVDVPAYGMIAAANAARLIGRRVVAYDFGHLWGVSGIKVWINHNGQPKPRSTWWPHIEDASQSIGIAGAFQDVPMSTLSFSVPKLVTIGQGGCVLTDHSEHADAVRNLTDHGGNWRETRIHERIGGNFRMTDYAAALGCSQLKRLPQLVERREQIHQQYREKLRDAPGNLDCGWCVIYQTPRAEALIAHLRERGIEAARFYRCITSHPPYRDSKSYPNAERAERELVYLPGGCSGISDAQVHLVCQAIREFEG